MSDLIVRGGTVFDPELGGFERRDVHVSDGRIVETVPSAADATLVEATGLIVTPGLVDAHVHVFRGQDLGIDPDVVGPRTGVTTMIDAGSAGGHLFGAFRATTVDVSAVRIRPLVNIASVGTTSIRLGGELSAPHYADERVAIRCVEENRDVVVGVKVRASHDVGGSHAPEAMARARRVADAVSLPLMVHLGPSPAAVDEILATLGPGDVITHAFTGFADNALVADGRVRASARDARARGMRFDVGHGASGFSAAVAGAAIREGFLPDTISSDLHAYSIDAVRGLPSVASKLLALGMTLDQVLERVTLAPARAFGLDREGVGTLRVGAVADLALFSLVEAPVRFEDGFGGSFEGDVELRPVVTIRAGALVWGDADGRAA